MKVAEVLSQLLARQGVTDVFGNPGTTELPFLEGVRQRYILTLHDSIALGAADGLAQISRGIAVANLHAAPGLGNSIGFLDSARRHHSPVLVTVGQQDLRHIDQDPLLHGDFESMVHGLVKYSHEVTSADEVGPVLARATRIALEPPMGPVLLSLPMNVMESEGKLPAAEPASPTSFEEPMDAVVETVKAAAHPAIVAGYGVDQDDAFAELAALSSALGAPVYGEPFCSRAPVPAALPEYAGDLLPAAALIDAALSEFDLVLLVGADLILYPYTPTPLLPHQRVAYLGSDPAVANKLHAVHAYGNLKRSLELLRSKLSPTGRTFRPPADFGRANRVARSARVMGGAFVLDAARRAFPEHTVVDEAVSLTPTLKASGFYRGRDSYFAARSGQLGWALSAAVGLGLRQPKLLAVVGDGALLYTAQALWTFSRYQIPVKTLVLNNGGYGILRSYSKAFHPSLTDAAYLQLPGVDIEALSKAYRVPSRSAGTPPELDEGLVWLRDSEGPALLDVRIDPSVPDLFG